MSDGAYSYSLLTLTNSEINILKLLARKKHDLPDHAGWAIYTSKNGYPCHWCYICDSKIHSSMVEILRHGKKHLEESNLLIFT